MRGPVYHGKSISEQRPDQWVDALHKRYIALELIRAFRHSLHHEITSHHQVAVWA